MKVSVEARVIQVLCSTEQGFLSKLSGHLPPLAAAAEEAHPAFFGWLARARRLKEPSGLGADVVNDLIEHYVVVSSGRQRCALCVDADDAIERGESEAEVTVVEGVLLGSSKRSPIKTKMYASCVSNERAAPPQVAKTWRV